MSNAEHLAKALVAGAKTYIDAELGFLKARIGELEKELAALRAADHAAVIKETVAGEVAKAAAALEAPAPDMAAIGELIAAEMAKRPVPRDGKDADEQGIVSAVMAQLAATITEMQRATERAAALKAPELPDVAKMVADEIAKLPRAKDGVGVAGALIDREGRLVVTLSDGTTKELGPVVGRDAAPEAIRAAVAAEIAALPKTEAMAAGDHLAIVSDVRGQLEGEVAAMRREIEAAAAEARAIEAPVLPDLDAMIAEKVAALPAPEPGRDADEGAILAALEEKIAPALGSIREAVDEARALKAPELPDIAAMMEPHIAAASAALEAARALKAPELPDIAAMMEPHIAAASAALEAARALKAPELPDVGEIVAAHVAKLPPAEKGEPGTSVTLDDVRPLVDEAVKREVEAAKATIQIPAGIAKTFIDREGKLILSMTDGSSIDVGPVVGKSADMEEIKALIEAAAAALPKPKDGADGLGFDDMEVLDTDEGVVLRFVRGDTVKDFLLPIPIDRGVWKLGETYHHGAGVTYDGSFWISQESGNTDKPGKSNKWRLAVRKGKDPRDPVKLDD